jgi:hypothetical protein
MITASMTEVHNTYERDSLVEAGDIRLEFILGKKDPQGPAVDRRGGIDQPSQLTRENSLVMIFLSILSVIFCFIFNST